MSDLDHARTMLKAASRDLNALRGVLDPGTFADEVFGFHAQQTVEKSPKAWLDLVGATYPKVHDLQELIALLKDASAQVPASFLELVDLTDFAVQFRYEAFGDMGDEINRDELIGQVSAVYSYVEELVQGN